MSKINEIPIPHLDPFIIGRTYLKLHPSSVFILSQNLLFTYIVLTCMRQERAIERYLNTVKDILLPNTISQKDEKQHTAGLDDTTIPHINI